MKTPLRYTLLAASLAGLTLGAQADPPSWAGKGNKGGHRAEAPDRQARAFNDREREALRRFGDRYRGDDLPPGLRKKMARGGDLPPGWRDKLREGRRLPDDLYYQGYRLPESVYRTPDGYSDVVIDNEVVRILDATQTIMDVFRLNR
ncbi:hypothetical protein [Alloalcanivorax profundimaris]|uniref:RcnB family protein n=1 Tax=Alloalcanivorax profundimaris TaxID=2735259 RepID=A0ABS0AUM7_9GAMM|nr:hypothetical protein [Alloalcanivorax profundimaris]MBF5057186.1 hypothetical protein [Alloalcanivorax profundimaris]